MNLDDLRKHILGATTTVEVGGISYRLAKLGAMDGIKVADVFNSCEKTGEGDDLKIAKREDLVRLYCALLSRCIVDDQGNKTLDSDDGREWLSRLPLEQLTALDDAATEWNYAAAKKN